MSRLHRALPMMILAVLMAASAASAADPTPRDQAVAQAKKLMKQGRHRDAAEAFRKAGKLGEGPCFDCLVGLAGALSGLGRHSEAVAAAREALQIPGIHPTRAALAYNELGAAQANESERNFDEAESNLRHAIDLGQDSVPVARYNLAELLRRRGRAAESAKMARSYLAVDPMGQKAREARIVLCGVAAERGVPRPDTGQAIRMTNAKAADAPRRLYAPSDVNLRSHATGLAGSKVRSHMIFELLVDQDGCVRRVEVLQEANKALAQSFAEAMRQWIYLPKMVDGQPVAVLWQEKIKLDIG
ncbi:MAG TPA: tetratricopeptide repeat protein [Thermoanaerobaculia bacterium]|nr:tetratricopeptide repeat protein [Thermoanaerobaculia bacterium]